MRWTLVAVMPGGGGGWGGARTCAVGLAVFVYIDNYSMLSLVSSPPIMGCGNTRLSTRLCLAPGPGPARLRLASSRCTPLSCKSSRRLKPLGRATKPTGLQRHVTQQPAWADQAAADTLRAHELWRPMLPGQCCRPPTVIAVAYIPVSLSSC
jgi:hypothetical protein